MGGKKQEQVLMQLSVRNDLRCCLGVKTPQWNAILIHTMLPSEWKRDTIRNRSSGQMQKESEKTR